jgi:diguanylate cyclase (GGDEF)-like protein
MRKVIFWSFAIGTGALLLTVINILITVPMFGEPYQASMFFNGVIGCYGIGSPVAYYCLKQAEKVKLANAELDRLHQELSKAHGSLLAKVRVDQMTGLLSREYFLKELKTHHEQTNAGSLLIIDADHFKNINDRWGHLCGDDALMKITNAIQSAVRSDDIVGRIGGEEFAVFLPGAASHIVSEVAERIRLAVEKIEFIPEAEPQAHPLSVSIGGVELSGLKDMAQIMGSADRNLYKAKNNGRNKVVISDQSGPHNNAQAA